MALKAFAPQLQTTLVKSLGDATKQVRARAATGLGQLMSLTTRVDSLVGELQAIYIAAESSAIKASTLDAMCSVLRAGGRKCTQVGYDKAKLTMLDALQSKVLGREYSRMNMHDTVMNA